MNAEKKRMTINLYALLAVLALSTLLFSCDKNNDDSDEITGNWKRGSEFDGLARTEAVTFTIGDTVYIGGGYDGNERLNDFWYYNQSNGYWKPIANFPGVARNSAVAFSINGKGYVGTGNDDNNNKLRDFWEYDPATDTWTRKADFSGTARYGAVGFSINGKGYIATGYDGSYLKDLWEYNPITNAWIQKASLGGSKKADAAVFVYNSKAYVVTGVNNGSYLNDFWVYDPSADTWEEKRKINSVSDDNYDDEYGSNILRSNAIIFVMNDKAYLTCGSANGITGTTWEYNIAGDTWEYNIAGDTWAQKTTFEGSAREGGLGFSINGRSFILTGSNSSYRFDDLWEFLPDAEADADDN